MNLQIAATLDGRLAAVGPIPVHGARHDAYALLSDARHEDDGVVRCDGVVEV
jgi:hypothetical protein